MNIGGGSKSPLAECGPQNRPQFVLLTASAGNDLMKSILLTIEVSRIDPGNNKA